MSIRKIAARAVAVAGVTMLVTVASGGVSSANAGATKVEGLMVPDQSGQCDQDPGSVAAYVVSGTLVGCWYVDTFDIDHTSAAGGFVSSGTEQFVGCLGATCGRFFTTYTFTAKFDSSGAEQHGRCHHPIVGGEDGFAGARGTIEMHDLPDGCSTYVGTVRL